MKIIFAWLLVASGCLGLFGLLAHILGQDLGLFAAPDVSAGYISIGGQVIDCATWWGKLFNLLIALSLFTWGWCILHNMKNRRGP